MTKSLAGIGVVMAALALVPEALAQRTTATLVGTVKDDTGGILPGVTVTIEGPNIVGSQMTVTNDDGFYRFVALPPGTYEVDFTMQGFAKMHRQGVKLSVGATEEVSVALKVSGQSASEEITVEATASVVDTQTNEISTNYDKDWVRNAPVPRFSMFDLLAAAPGVQRGTQGSTAFTAFGSGMDENSFQIDGTNLTAPSTGNAWPYPNTDAIEEIEVLALGAPAEYGNLTGAVFNVVTRQGTNDFHGDANYYFQTDGLTSRNTTEAEDGGLPFYRKHFHDATFQLSGPIIKDKLHFFASYQYQSDAKSPAGVRPQDYTDETAHRVFGKLNWQINSNHKLALGFHNDYYRLPFTPAANLAASTIAVNTGDNPTPNLMYTGVLSDRTVVEARVAGFWGNDHADPIVDTEPRIKPRFYDLDTGNVTGGIYYWYDDKSYQGTASVKVSHFADDFLGASHDFKFGVQYLNGGVHDAAIGYNDLIYTYDYTYTDYYGYESTYKVAYGYDYSPFAYGGTTTGLGAFFDDTVRVSDRLTINLGLRYDHNVAKIPELNVLDEQGNPTGDHVPGRSLYTWNVWSPRIGFNLKLTSDGKTVLRGHYGRYYRAIVTGEYTSNVGISPNVTRAGYWDLENGGFIDPVVIAERPSNVRVDPNYQNPYTDQFVVSLERELIPNLGLSLHYVNKKSKRGPAWRDVTGEYEDVTVYDDVGSQATGRPISVKRLLTDPADSFYELSNDERVKTDTQAFTAQLNKRMSNGWQLVAAYTYLDSSGILPSTRGGLTSSQSATARYSSFGQNPNDFVNAGGRLLADRPHSFKAQLVVELPFDFLVGANYLFQSGRAWPRRNRIPDLGFPTDPNVNLEERGDRRLPNQSILDLRLQKSFKLGEEFKLVLFADGLNIFNSDNYEDLLSTNVTSDSYEVPSEFLAPRRIMLGAKVTF